MSRGAVLMSGVTGITGGVALAIGNEKAQRRGRDLLPSPFAVRPFSSHPPGTDSRRPPRTLPTGGGGQGPHETARERVPRASCAPGTHSRNPAQLPAAVPHLPFSFRAARRNLFRVPPPPPRTPEARAAGARRRGVFPHAVSGKNASDVEVGKGPAVLLVHGWGGHAGRLTPFVRALVRAGFSSSRSTPPATGSLAAGFRRCRSSSRRSARHGGRVRPLSRRHRALARRGGRGARGPGGLAARRLVLLAPPSDLEKYTGRFARIMRIPPTVRDSDEKSGSRNAFQIRWAELKVAGHPASTEVSLLIFHDRRDVRVPCATASRSSTAGRTRSSCEPADSGTTASFATRESSPAPSALSRGDRPVASPPPRRAGPRPSLLSPLPEDSLKATPDAPSGRADCMLSSHTLLGSA